MDSKTNITITSTTIKTLIIIYLMLLATIFLVSSDMLVPVVFAAGGYGLVLWIIIFVDILNNKIYNKVFWIMSMFILSTLAIVVYPFIRERLISMGEKYPNRS